MEEELLQRSAVGPGRDPSNSVAPRIDKRWNWWEGERGDVGEELRMESVYAGARVKYTQGGRLERWMGLGACKKEEAGRTS